MREPFALTVDELRRLAPNADADILKGLAAASPLLEDYGLAVSPLRLCHFLAQAAHESGGFATLVERGGAGYFARAYGHRRDLGNRSGEDGARFRGRGLFQLTGRANYRRYGDRIGLDLEAHPELAARPDVSLRIALEYWRTHDLNRAADANDIRRVTRAINGGRNGLADRRRYFERARAIFDDASPPPPARALRAGATGIAVRLLQQRLAARGHPLSVDGRFGRETATALKKFQREQGLVADGVFGQATRAALAAAAAATSASSTFLVTQPKEIAQMDQWKSYLKSRTIWANLVALAAFGLDIGGFGGLAGDNQAQLVDAILQMVQAGGIVSGIFFRAVAANRLGPRLL
jgi:putative chitinase